MALRAFIGSRLEQDHVGEAAGSLLRVVQSADSLPPGESGRDDYVLDLPRTADPDIDPGTASEGLVVATESLSRGVLIAVPVTGDWSAARIEGLLTGQAGLQTDCLVIANSATRFLWSSRVDPLTVLDYLLTGDPAGPGSEWDVGHFTAILGLVTGKAGGVAVCADTYRSLGNNGVHLQPLERVADSLRRDDSAFDGGVLLLIRAGGYEALIDLLVGVGLR